MLHLICLKIYPRFVALRSRPPKSSNAGAIFQLVSIDQFIASVANGVLSDTKFGSDAALH